MAEGMELVPKDTTEDQMINLWIRSKESEHTRAAYRRHINLFRSFLGKPINQATLFDLQDFADHLKEHSRSENTRKIIINAVKSYMTFASKALMLPVNVGHALKAPKGDETIGERILSEYEVMSMMKAEKNLRNNVILRVLYGGAMRVSELCSLRWRDVVDRGELLQLSITGKGNKKRHVVLNEDASRALRSLPTDDLDQYIFRSENYHSDQLTARAVQNIVKNAAKKAGIDRWQDVSPHWMRHSHATHSIHHGAPLPLVRDTLGHRNIKTTNTYVHVRPGDSSARYLPSF